MLCIIFHILFHYGLLKNVEYRRTPVLMSVLKMFDFFFTHPAKQLGQDVLAPLLHMFS